MTCSPILAASLVGLTVGATILTATIALVALLILFTPGAPADEEAIEPERPQA